MANNYNFVKFLRGSQAAYDRLANPDINTLYFIYLMKGEEVYGFNKDWKVYC